MYLAIFDENKKHISNINNVTYELIQRVYDQDNFSAKGVTDIDINNACFLILNDDEGNYEYACFANGITPNDSLREIKGLDFRQLLNTEILLDYTKENSFKAGLYYILKDVCDSVFNNPDLTIKKLDVEVIIPDDAKSIDTFEYFGTLQNQYKIVNAYGFLKAYLKFYEYNLTTWFDLINQKLIFQFVKVNKKISIDLSDFGHTLETTSIEINKAVATLKFNPISQNNDGIEIIIPRPNTLATKYYYRTKDNNIVESNEVGNIENRIYPVIQKVFEAEYLADSQYDAVYELANARYVDNIILENNSLVDPMDFSKLPLYTMFNLFYEGKFYKSLPITEINKKYDATGFQTKIKLGFKKIYLTEIIKNQGGK